MNQNRKYYPIRPAHRIASGYRTSVSARTWRSGNLRSYQALAPGGDVLSFAITTTHSLAQSPSVHCSLITAHSSHTFSAKEKDSETGLTYFGARYYSSNLSIWLSVDPMSDKYPHQSNYVYCSNNPIRVIDPNGEDEWQLNKENGTFTRVGDKGGNTTDYYSIGTMDKDGNFQEESNHSINRDGKCNINSFRIQESQNATLSAFHIPDAKKGEISSGFFLERSGPDTEKSGEKKRILAGSYGLTKNYAENSKYPNSPRLYRESEKTSEGYGAFAKRGILIHVGNYYTNGVGCLLPGSSKGKTNGDYSVSNSGETVNKIIELCRSRGWDNMRINIINVF